MFVIRKGCFETNSSSMDYYRDSYDKYDDEYEYNGPSGASATQEINILLEFNDDVSEQKAIEILEKIVENINNGDELGDKIIDLLDTGFTEEDVNDYNATIDETDNVSFTISYELYVPVYEDYHTEMLMWDVEGLFSDVTTRDKDSDVMNDISEILRKEYREIRKVTKFYIGDLDVDESTAV